ncbi:tRNA (N6-threonylcarbamoyladenosine(37)-N6)-methyltransferase TrmO [Sorangium sp. So ce117]|uniref:tRNA (N6-threonylcarbamoyladenosine(37)-N6)-methyltransferase TrmO n=1 Tax=Sorangium sp. So ce117 TaxID=3133277 RepID=UPI003F608DDE
MLKPVTFTPIGVVRTPFSDKVSAPRQPHAAGSAEGTIELVPGLGLEHALSDIEGWDYLWVVFWFHLNEGWRPKVLPPRSAGKRRGVLSTRSPHRPNPIGLSAVRLLAVDGLTLRVGGVDMVDGTPVLDLKPYVPYADAHPHARTGWLTPLAEEPGGGAPVDPEPGFEVAWGARAAEQAAWIEEAHGFALRERVERVLALGPQPHPYRRIRADGDAMRLAVTSWRVRFRAEGRRIDVLSVATGYREKELVGGEGPDLEAHRRFVERFGRG